MSSEITFTVYGLPQPAGSKKGFPIRRANGATGVVITDDNKRSKPWAADVKTAAVKAVGEAFALLTGPVSIEMHFWMPRPKGHYRTGANADRLRDAAPRLPTGKPDVLKLARCIEDALTNVVWGDDAQITTELLTKSYATADRGPRVMVVVKPDTRS